MIKLNIQMPQCCEDCFALDDCGDYPTCRITLTSRGYTFNTREKRMPDCPLIEEEDNNTEMITTESTTYSNTICPKCHSANVIWNLNAKNETILQCLNCNHEFNPPVYLPTSKYKIITLCGSTRFRDTFLWIQKELTLAGYIVISVGCFGHYENETEQKRIEAKKVMLDDMHKCKIDMADAIFVINQDNYIGKSTASEIEYAREHHKEIYYLIPPQEAHVNENYS